MDARRFDAMARTITRVLGAVGTRRRWLAAAAGLATIGRGADRAGAACSVNLGDECTRDAQCCRGICKRPPGGSGKKPKPGRCACLGQDAACERPSQCCGNLTCFQGRCLGPGGGPTRRCTPSACGDGCCAGTRCVRQPRQSAGQCGRSGGRCAACATGEQCVAGACVNAACNAGSCPDGCCATDDVCIPFAYENVAACGSGGIACEVCGPDQCCNPEGCGFCL